MIREHGALSSTITQGRNVSYVPGRPGMQSEIRKCAICQSTKTSLTYHKGRSYPQWLHKPEGLICMICYNRIYSVPRIIIFRKKRYLLKKNPRTGICSRCFRSKARGEIKRTQMHHTSYDPTDVLANTMELCVRCHYQMHPRAINPKDIRGKFRKAPQSP